MKGNFVKNMLELNFPKLKKDLQIKCPEQQTQETVVPTQAITITAASSLIFLSPLSSSPPPLANIFSQQQEGAFKNPSHILSHLYSKPSCDCISCAVLYTP